MRDMRTHTYTIYHTYLAIQTRVLSKHLEFECFVSLSMSVYGCETEPVSLSVGICEYEDMNEIKTE